MIDAVLAISANAPIKAGDLVDHPFIVEKVARPRIDQRKQVAIKV